MTLRRLTKVSTEYISFFAETFTALAKTAARLHGLMKQVLKPSGWEHRDGGDGGLWSRRVGSGNSKALGSSWGDL